MIYFAAHTLKCVCHCRRVIFRVLGMYNFGLTVTTLTAFQIQMTGRILRRVDASMLCDTLRLIHSPNY